MPLFLDTSALIKLFVNEAGSPAVQQAASQEPEILLAWLAPHEFLSALQRRQRSGSISPVRAGELRAEIQTLLRTSATLVPYTDMVSQRALDLIERHGMEGLRTLDAFQLASALERPQATFGVSDKTLAEVARKAGLSVAYFA